MMMAKKGKKTKSQLGYLRKGILSRNKLGSAIGESDQFSWRFSDMDDWFMTDSGKEGSLNWKSKDDSHVAKIMERMKRLERLGWKQLINDRKNHHFIKVIDMNEKARKRWSDVFFKKEKFTKYDELFSLKIDSVKRFFGVKEGGVFIVIWYDPYHQICPSAKKNT